MKYREFQWHSPEGKPGFACEWLPDELSGIQAVVVIVHGMGEHTGRYLHVADHLTTHGYAVLAFDQHGHGRTDGKRGHIRTYDNLLEGVDFLLAEAERLFPEKPRFLFGHSMGGNVTLNYLLRRRPQIAGAVVTGPWLKLAFDPPAVRVVMARAINRLYPAWTDNRPLQPNHLTSDLEMVRRIKEDPLGHGSITARFFLSVQHAGLWALKHASELSVPVLLMHGGDDKVTSIHASRRFAELAGDRCKFMEWPGLRHELHNEAERDKVFAVIREWFAERLS
ncbi:alpha/beta hydrolase [Cohnella pontilimi]|uniref:Alpha/beta hydrolase n=1 Tax=Cohnella pontilimi TaxID=2564100 RepID=A0A4U0FD20_9BACL|nr:alpha/beta hydrolase [Cohnella pontilimi]TJY42803.1 alpha/beta hydrolase [Cohnella pontilimi]